MIAYSEHHLSGLCEMFSLFGQVDQLDPYPFDRSEPLSNVRILGCTNVNEGFLVPERVGGQECRRVGG